MNDFRYYLQQAERQYKFRIKSVVELNDVRMSKIEQVLLRYKPLDIGKVGRTILINNPVDFHGMTTEVYFFDVVLGLPVGAYVLMQQIRDALSIPERFIVVRAPNDPNELEHEMLQAREEMNVKAEKSGLEQAALLNDANYSEVEGPEGKELYGTAYNKRLVKYLADVQHKWDEVVAVPGKPSLFQWMKEFPSAEDYNKDLKDNTPAISPDLPATSKYGNLDNDTNFYTRLYRDRQGGEKVLKTTKKSSGKSK